MQTNTTHQLPHQLHGVQVRTIGWQKIKDEAVSVFFPPLPVKLGMMVFCVIRDQRHFTPLSGTHCEQFLHEVMEALGVELVRFSHGDKQPIPQSHGPKVPYTFTPWEMPNHRVLDLGWNPHPASRTVLLKMNFIKRPQVDPFIPDYGSKFFLYSSCRAGSALAITGRGFRIRNPIWRKRRWHCLAPNEIPYCNWMNSDKVLPSQMLVPIPTSNGDCRRASPIFRNSSSPIRDGLPGRSRSTSEGFPNLPELFITYSGRPTRTLQVNKSGKALCLETMDPVFHGPWGIPKQSPDFRTTHPLCDKQYRMQSMVVPRITRPANLVLEAKYY